jgi:hypothetical protein
VFFSLATPGFSIRRRRQFEKQIHGFTSPHFDATISHSAPTITTYEDTISARQQLIKNKFTL